MVVVGTSLPPLERQLGSADLVAYAGATWDWHRMHHDHDHARALGFPGPVVDGQMLGALLVEQLQDGLGLGAFVRELDLRYRAPVFAGGAVRCEATVTAVEGDAVAVEQRVVASAQHGLPERVAATATARVEVPS